MASRSRKRSRKDDAAELIAFSETSVKTVPFDAAEQAIEHERARLSLADSILGCASMAMADAEENEADDLPYFPDVVNLARKLIRESVEQLDSVNIGPLIERARTQS